MGWSKFRGLEQVVSRIDVRSCDAKRPHEIQDKKIFLSKLHGIEDEVSAKLRRELQQWLVLASEEVIYRTDPHRPRLDSAAMALEAAEIGDYWWKELALGRDKSWWLSCGLPYAVYVKGGGARLTALLERLPRMAPLVILLGYLMRSASFIALGVWWWGVEGAGSSSGWWALALFLGGSSMTWVGEDFGEHQGSRQLRRTPDALRRWVDAAPG